MRLTVDGKDIEIDADPQMPLLWALRDIAGILGPKFGCGIAACGACTVVIDGAMGGNLCRCGTYPRIRSAIKRAAALKLARA